jgi:DNA polymerase
MDLDAEVVAHIESGGEIHAHNAAFEIAIWNNICVPKMGWPQPRLDQWYCTAGLAASFGLPRSLDKAGQALNLKVTKDKEGTSVMMRLCKPAQVIKEGLFGDQICWIEDSRYFEILYKYCRQDVLAEWAIHHALPEQLPFEREIWLANEKCNQLGVPVAVDDVRYADLIVKTCQDAANERVKDITGGKATRVSEIAKLLRWMRSEGVESESLDEDSVNRLLSRELPDDVREVLLLRKHNGLASVGKLPALINRTDKKGRACGTINYYGATATGRFSGRGFQPHNFPRGGLKDAQVTQARHIIGDAHRTSAEKMASLATIAPPVEVVSGVLRSFIEAPKGKTLFVADYAAIEARVLAWLAGEQRLVELFEEGDKTGDSIVYEDMASRITGEPLENCTKETKEGFHRRQLGKMAVLGCGYSMGWRALKEQGYSQYGVELTTKEAKNIVRMYRESNPYIKEFWREINQKCIKAVQNPGKVYNIGSHLQCVSSPRWLRIRLPSGRCLHYHKPVVRRVVAPWTVGYVGDLNIPVDCDMAKAVEWLEDRDVRFREEDVYRVDRTVANAFIPEGLLKVVQKALGKQDVCMCDTEVIDQIEFTGVTQNHKWGPKRLYGGLLTENVTQAVARDMLGAAMVNAFDAGYPVIMHVHDELVAEMPEDRTDISAFEELMATPEPWAIGCPIAVEGFISKRYKK